MELNRMWGLLYKLNLINYHKMAMMHNFLASHSIRIKRDNQYNILMKICKLCKKQNNRFKSDFCSILCKTKHWRNDNKESVALSCKKYYYANKEKISKDDEIHYLENKDKLKAKSKKYAKENPGKRRASASKRHAATLNAIPANLTKEDWDKIDSFYKEAQKLSKETGIPYEVDHIIPLQGKEIKGEHAPWNLRVITREENRKKSNKVINVIK